MARLRSQVAASHLVLVVALGVGSLGAAAVLAGSSARAAQTSCPAAISLGNGDFEAPTVSPGAGRDISDTNPSAVWKTTATDTQIEYWANGGNVQGANGGLPISAQQGSQWVELNANQPSTLYQDLATVPGQVLHWSLWHRARYVGVANGQDVMRVLIGTTTAQAQQGANISDGPNAWGNTTGTYVVPAGQTTTRFAFQAVSSVNGNPTFGNFLDDIEFSNSPCLSLVKSVTNLTVGSGGLTRPGDTLRYTVTATNAGGDDASNSVLSDPIPANTTYVPGSLVVSGAAVTDATDGDTGEVSGGIVTGRIGSSATGTVGGNVSQGVSTTMTFDVEVDAGASAGAQITNSASAAYQWNPSPTVLTATSNTTTSTVDVPGIDLVKTIAGTTDVNADGKLAAGDRIAYSFDVTNTGSTALTSVAVNDTKATVTCPSGTLAPGATQTCTADYTLSQADVDHSPLVNTATATGTPPSGAAPIASVPSTASQALNQTASLSLTKQGHPTDTTGDGDIGAGDTITWTFVITNTGVVTLTNVAVTDAAAGPVTCQTTSLAPGDTTQCSADQPYTITAADVAAGGVRNQASADAQCGCPTTVLAARASAVVPTNAGTLTNGSGLAVTGAPGLSRLIAAGLMALLLGTSVLTLGTRRPQ